MEKLEAGTEYVDEGLVFATRLGLVLDPQNVVSRHFNKALEAAGLPRIRFHDLRHTCALC
tara:strand:+ start:174 stop:353 length:180 start_codon:yes stop_codon:yes gene_type:complete